jgi:3-oxocholest-4-en-26-oyl-CoA dehydrogenase alpha subunit
MDFEFSEEELDLRLEAEEFVKQELPADWDDNVCDWPGGYGTMPQFESEYSDFTRGFLRKLGERGWHSLSWPEEYGGQNSTMKQAIVNDVLSYYRAPTGGLAMSIIGPTIVQAGSAELKREFLPKIARGEAVFWLGYSEPNSGSDLASIKTTAVAEGDEFVINGQKVWSTGAHTADYAWMLARTDPEAPNHKAATLIIVESGAPGVTIKPIVNICGVHSFNEVFFDDVRVPKKNVVGEINQGFYNLVLALQFERLIVPSGTFRRVLEEMVEYARNNMREGVLLAKDPIIRRKLAEMAVEVEVLYGYYWQTAWMLDNDRVPDMEASALKLTASELGLTMANVAVDLLGPYGVLDKGSKWAPFGGRMGVGYLDAVSGPIGAGTSEVQKNIIATRGLGMPRA